jgi:hypothetical protein
MRAVPRRVLDALESRNSARIASEGWAFHAPTICEEWLHDRRRVQWLQEQLGKSELDYSAARHDQQIGEIFCTVIEAWGDQLVKQSAPEPQAIMTDSDFTSWQKAMREHPWT